MSSAAPIIAATPAPTPAAAAAPTPEPRPGLDRMRDGPILATLVALTLPNLLALGSAAIVTIAETAYVGRLGVPALGGVALVFPVIMLMQMLSGGALGGGISGAIARAAGAGEQGRAEALALCGAVIGLAVGLAFGVLVWVFGPAIYAALGGSGATLAEASAFSAVAAFGIPGIWMANSLGAVARGSGNMIVPALAALGAGVIQIAVGGGLGLGLMGLPRLGMAGVAAGQVVGFGLSALAVLLFLRAPGRRLRLRFDGDLLERARFADIARVALPAALSPLQSIAVILILTALVARFGPAALAGYGIGARLEFLLIPIAFAIGVACVPMVGTAVGAGNIARARRIAWTAGGLSAGVLAVVGAIVMLFPDLWARLFVSDPAVLAVTRLYLRIAGGAFPFFGLALCLYFAAQGAGKVGGPIVAQSLRLGIVIIGGWALAESPLWTVFAISAVAMVVQGLGTAVAVRVTPWGVR